MARNGEKKPKKTGRRKIERPAQVQPAADQPVSEQAQATPATDQEQGSQLMDQSTAQGAVYAAKELPSQAEGERETVEEDLREKEEESSNRD